MMEESVMPNGLIPSRKSGNAYNTSGFSRYRIANTYASNMFTGDLVRVSAGTIQIATTATKDNIGVFMGCRYVDPNSKRPTWSKYWPASTSSSDATPYAFVDDDRNTIFEIDANATVSVGVIQVQNFDVTTSTSGSTLTGNSGMALNVGSMATATGQLRVVEIKDSPGNADSATPKVLVRIVDQIDAFVTAGTSAG